jgi:hypothetical protein
MMVSTSSREIAVARHGRAHRFARDTESALNSADRRVL